MDITFILSAIIFTLLAIVVATSVFSGSSPSADFARGYFRCSTDAGGLDKSDPKQNGCVSDKKKTTPSDDWAEVSGSSHDHWDVVKSVLSEELHSNVDTTELSTTPPGPSAASLHSNRPSTQDMSRNPSSEPSSEECRRSIIGLSEEDLLKCAFFRPQTEGASESPLSNDQNHDNNTSPMKYVPGMLRTSQMQMMMSKEELEEEQRVQREQLAAIFQLLKDNKETFGEVSEVDMEEQLKLYSI